MSYIEEIPVQYGADRNNLVTRIGPSTGSSPGEREEFNHYNIWVPAQDLINDPITGSCTVMTTSGAGSSFRVQTRVFQSGSTQQASTCIRRPRAVQSGQITGRVWYTGLADSGKKIIVALDFSSTTEQDGLPVFGSSTGYTDTIDPPGTDGELMIYRADQTTATGFGHFTVNPDDDIFRASITRYGASGSDTYPEEWLVVGLEIMFRPEGSEGIAVSPWLMKD